jgi:hypothetical protein
MNLGARVGVRAVMTLLLSSAASFSSGTDAKAEIFKGYPDVIVCRVNNTQAAVYIANVNDDGSAVYKTLGDAFATVTADRVFHREGAKDCDGKTIDQLKKDGQARELH